ncbi:MAG: class I SAM-dependent methyltransferase [Gemmatimonadaceae bacterium]
MQSDFAFGSSISEVYERLLVPMIFRPYADDLAARLLPRTRATAVLRVLEIAAGTGAVTRAMAAAFPEQVEIVATDLNQTMLDRAIHVGVDRPVEWRQANAMSLPFADEAFDVVVCQFGVMFFPDKAKAFAETRRVLRRGGLFLFNVWDRIEDNEFAETVTNSMSQVFPDNPAQFMARTPHGYFDIAQIGNDLRAGGFLGPVDFTTKTSRSRANSARDVAIAFCQGTPLRNEIEARDATRLGEVTNIAERAIAAQFGDNAVEGRIQAIVVAVERTA